MKHILITLFTITLLACGGAEERKAAYLEKARISMEAGDLDKARIELKNVLQIDPKDAEAVFQLGNVHELKKEYQKAFTNYFKAAELVPENTEYQAKLGTFYLLSGDNEKAREAVNKINEIDPGNVGKGVLEVSLHLREGDTASAISLAKKLINDNPDELKPVLILSQIYKKQSDYDSALSLLHKASRMKSDDTSIKKEIIGILTYLKKYDEAEEILKGVIQQEPDEYKNITLLAILYKSKGDEESGEKVLRDALKNEDFGITAKLTLVSYINETRGSSAAEEEIRLQISNSDREEKNALRLALAKLYHDSKASEKEMGVYKEIIASGDSSSTGMNARINLSKVLIGDNKIDEAMAVINEALELSPNDADTLLLRSKLSLINDDVERAIIDLRLVVKDKPEEIEAYTLLINAHLKNNEPDQLKEVLNNAYENNIYNAASLLDLADLNIKLKNIDGAEKAVDGVIRIDGNNLKALTLKAKILNTRKDFQHSQEVAKKIIELYPDNVDGYTLIVPSMLNSGQADELYSLISDGYAKTGYDQKLLEILVAINSGQKKFDTAISLINSEIGKRGQDAALYRMLAKVYDASGNSTASTNNFKKALKEKDDWTELYIELANIYLRSDKADDAVGVLKQGKARMPKNSNIQLSLAAIYEKTNQQDNAISEYEELLVDNADNIVVINNLASLLSDHRVDKKGIDRALSLVEKLKDNKQPALQDTVGWVYYRAGKYNDAVKILQPVVEQSPDIPVFNYHLGMALSKTGDNVSAKNYLTKSLANGDEFPGKDEAEVQLRQLK